MDGEAAPEAPEDVETELDPAPAMEVEEPMPEPPVSVGAVAAGYVQVVALVVGAGLVASAVVDLAAVPIVAGALVLAVASVALEADRRPARLARTAASACALALGLGMVCGGVQHFGAAPERAKLLIPAGLVLSLAAFLLRHERRPAMRELAGYVPAVAVGLLGLVLGLGALAGKPAPAEERGAKAAHHPGPPAEPKPKPKAHEPQEHAPTPRKAARPKAEHRVAARPAAPARTAGATAQARRIAHVRRAEALRELDAMAAREAREHPPDPPILVAGGG